MHASPNGAEESRRSIDRRPKTSPAKLAHVALATRDVQAMRDWYVEVLGGTVPFEGPGIAFISYDDEHHRIALVELPGLDERSGAPRVGMHHIAFTFADLGDLLATYRRLKAAGIEPYWPINHGVTTSIYYQDPEGNVIEFQVDNFAVASDATDYMKNNFGENPIGVNFDPEELIARYESGEPFEELRKRPKLPDGVNPFDLIPD